MAKKKLFKLSNVFLNQILMMKKFLIAFNFFCILNFLAGQNQPPEIQELEAIIANPGELVIFYDLIDAENDDIEISFLLSDNGGRHYHLNTSSASGDIGFPVSPGLSKEIIWNYTSLALDNGNYHVKLVANDRYEIDIQELVDQVDTSRLRADLEIIEGVRHRTAGAAHLGEVKNWIFQTFTDHNLENESTAWDYEGYNAQNFVGRKPGLIQDGETYIVDGHYDTVSISPGADDNGSAVVGVMEVLRVLSPYQFNKSIKFIAFDLEEAGLIGSLFYTNNGGILSYEEVLGVYNFEMIGYYSETPGSQVFPNGFDILYPDVYATVANNDFRGDFITNVGIEYATDFMQAYEDAAIKYVPELKVLSVAAPEQWILLTPDLARSDHAAFWLNNLPAIMLTDGANFRNPNYHTANDKIETLNFEFMANVVKATVASLAELAELSHSSFATVQPVMSVNIEEVPSCTYVLAPNPASDFLSVTLHDCDDGGMSKIELLDLQGGIIYQEQFPIPTRDHKILTRSFPTGVYLLKSDGKDRQHISKVLIYN